MQVVGLPQTLGVLVNAALTVTVRVPNTYYSTRVN